MKKFSEAIVIIGLMLAMGLAFYKIADSDLNKNTRELNATLADQDKQASGSLSSKIDFDYDTLYVFEPYLSKEEISKQVGFKHQIIKESNSEDVLNAMFVKDNKPIAYLYGYPGNIGYSLNLDFKEYLKPEIDNITYTSKVIEGFSELSGEYSYIEYNLSK